MSWSEHVYPHGELIELIPGLWQVTGSLGRQAILRNMAVWRVDGGLVIHSAVCLDEAGMAALEALGEPRVLVVPNGFHRADAPHYKARYPGLTVVAAPGTRARVEQVIPVDADAAEVLEPLGIGCMLPRGLKPLEYVFRVPSADGRHGLVITDALFNHPDVTGIQGFVFKYLTASTGHFGISRLGRWLLLRERDAFAGFLRELADEPGLAAISVAHGDAITLDPAGALRGAADRV